MDKDGGESVPATHTITVTPAALQPDVGDPTQTMLVVGGTPGPDRIQFRRGASSAEVLVDINGTTYGPLTPTGGLLAFGQGGDDFIDVGNVPRNAWLYGDDGNDTVAGGSQNDILLGGTGDDQLLGRDGRDIAIGGVGADVVLAGNGDDLMFDGTTRFDDNPQALAAIQKEWTAARTFLKRVRNLRGDDHPEFGDRLNLNYFLKAGLGATVFADGAHDNLVGEAGNCWFFANLDAVARDDYDFGGADVVEDVDLPGTEHVGPVAAYNFNAGTGTVLVDTTGNGHDGAIAGATWSGSGYFGSALSFDGINNWVTVADADALDLTTGMTLMAWVRPKVLGDWRTVLLKETAGLPNGLSYGLYGHDPQANRPDVFVNTGGSDQSAAGTAKLPVNAWTHLTATYDGLNLRLYVNGVLTATRTVTNSLRLTGNPLRIGGNAVWGEFFNGLIDEVRVYDRALSAAEIPSDMTTPIGGGNLQAPRHVGPATETANGLVLTPGDAVPLIEAAIRRWAGLGATTQQIEVLRQADVAIADLPEGSLGFTAGRTIRIDPDAAGYGWFIDPTPWQDSEFGPGTPSVAGVDLLTVLVHEMGHTLGFEHSDRPGDVMEPELAPGVRRIEHMDGRGPEPTATAPPSGQSAALTSLLVDARGIWDNRKVEVRSTEPELPEGRPFWVGFTPTPDNEAAESPESAHLANGKWTDRPETEWSLFGDGWDSLDGS